jgi:cytochrome c553
MLQILKKQINTSRTAETCSLCHPVKSGLAVILSLTLFWPTCAISINSNIDSPESKPVETTENKSEITNDITKALVLKPDLDNGKKIYVMCGQCHMDTGWGKKDGSFPVIAGQHRNVLIKQLEDIQKKNRDNPTMFPFSNPAEIGGLQGVSDVTAYIATLEGNPDPGVGSGKNLERGEKLYQQRCAQCHGDNGQGNNATFFPRLQGQHHAYLLRQLQWIRDGYRKNSNEAMLQQIESLNDEELDAISDYLSRL